VIDGLPEGETTVELRRRDSAGNVADFTAPAARFRRDRTPPAVTASGPPAEVRAGTFLSLVAQGSDATSGVERLEAEWRVDGGAWQPYGGALRAEAGRTFELRARAVDRAGLSSPYITFTTVVRFDIQGPGADGGSGQDPRLAIKSARRRGRYLIVSGTTAPGVVARVTVRVKIPKRKRAVVRRVSPRGGQWRLRIRLPRTPAKRATVRASVPAAGAFKAGAAGRVAKLRRTAR
jgi:hypothetical protein